MKIKIEKNIKICLLAVCPLIICFMLYLIFRHITNPGLMEEKQVLYSCNHTPSVGYEVFLKPNILFETESIGEDQIYFAEYVDHIEANFTYKVSGNRAADIDATYEITAVVEGFTGAEGAPALWQKEFPLVPEKTVNKQGNSLTITEDLSILLDTYNSFSRQVVETSKVSMDSKLMISMNVKTKIKAPTGETIEENFSPTLVIPLNRSYFSITKTGQQERPNTVENIKKVQLPLNTKLIVLYCIVILICIASILLLFFFTADLPEKSPLEKSVDKIFREHGSRIVALENEIVKEFGDYIKVHSIDDLVRIADELGKPIMYTYSGNQNELTRLFILEGPLMYVYDLLEPNLEASVPEKVT
ncbi:MAG TPA: DUF5305 domain-containing protein [Clostridiaceae bacterium]|nr:DUF5305 domain-containing protein [Clostridiaceae bacterium]